MNEKLLDGSNSKITYNYIKYLEDMNKKPDFSVDEFVKSGKCCDSGEEKINETECGKATGIEVVEEKKGCFLKDECMICYEKLGRKKTIGCKLCEYRCHKDCYKRFTKKNQYFLMRCLHCQTRTIDYKKKKIYMLCCFC
jgi:hypothetical protein